MDCEWEHHVWDCQGDDENIRGLQFLPPQSDDQDDEEVEEETYKHCNIIWTITEILIPCHWSEATSTPQKYTYDKKVESYGEIFCWIHNMKARNLD